MGLWRIVNIVAAPRLRFETINDRGISWPVTMHTGHVVLEPDPAGGDGTVSFVIPDAYPATRAPREPMVVETSLRAVRSPAGVAVDAGAYDVRVDIVPDPSGAKKNVVPQISFRVPAGADHIEINYRLILEDS